ncbi:MAG: neutral zinc metallopeptidase, partial [Thermoanaerobaculia bacterium]|nr:neutral zinc metallopeptidase [Thermoanaerobaculia bacterium]
VRLGGWGILIVLVISFVTGTNPLELLSVIGQAESSLPSSSSQAPAQRDPQEDQMAQMISVVLADTETTWTEVFAAEGQRYQLPKLVLFTDAVQSACGRTSAAVGPFYCPGDQTVYIDLSFYNELGSRFGAPGDFAQAYVVAHEVGHHVQNLLGISQQVTQEQRRVGRAQANALSVRLELQADCLAGVWGHHAAKKRNLLEPGDVEEGLAAAAAIGDDRLQKQAGARVRPESFTHGTSEQRVHWFREGLQTGDSDRCDTFAQGSF